MFLEEMRNFLENACLFLTQSRKNPNNACLFVKELRKKSPEKRLFLIRTVSYLRGTPVGPYGGPRGGALSYERGTPELEVNPGPGKGHPLPNETVTT